MVRGRKRDVSAPLTRSLVLQRDYRARKAQHVSDLEARCQKLENDNNKLSKEVEDLKSKLVQKEMDRKETLASLTTEAELEKAHALNNVMFSLSSAAASIKSFQNLTMGPNYNASEESSVERKPSLTDRRSTRPSPSTMPSNLSACSDPVGLSTGSLRPLQLYSPVSNSSRSSSLSISSSQYGGHDNWNDISPGFITQGLPGDVDMDMDAVATHSRHCDMRPSVNCDVRGAYPPSQGRPSPLIDFSNNSQSPSAPLPRASPSSSTFLEDGSSGFRSRRSSHRNIHAYNRIHGSTGQMIPFTSNEVLQDIHPIASYERTLSQSLRNWV